MKTINVVKEVIGLYYNHLKSSKWQENSKKWNVRNKTMLLKFRKNKKCTSGETGTNQPLPPNHKFISHAPFFLQKNKLYNYLSIVKWIDKNFFINKHAFQISSTLSFFYISNNSFSSKIQKALYLPSNNTPLLMRGFI